MVVNTCGFIEAARVESFSAAMDEMLELKRRGDLRGVIVSGCLAERQREKALLLAEHRPEIDHLVGVFGREKRSPRWQTVWSADLEEQRLVFQPSTLASAARHRSRLRDHTEALRLS